MADADSSVGGEQFDVGLVRRWLGLGPSKAQLMERLERCNRWRLRAEKQRNEAYARAKAAEAQLRRIKHELHQQLNQPERVEGCTKVQFHERAGAQGWLEKIAAGVGEPEESYTTYECKTCPRSPVTMRRYWHVGHTGSRKSRQTQAEAKDRRGRQQSHAHREGRLVAQRIDPTLLAKLRKQLSSE